ncbi:MAG: sugar phosphate nucleotidyltransferase [Candidatus Zixiibacteriota bacterium]
MSGLAPGGGGMADALCDAVVLAGGFGTRLKPLTASLPKPMVPVGNRPLMEYVIDLLATHGLKNVMVLLFFQAEHIIEHFGDGARFGVSIRYLRPEGDFGTAGSVRQALPQLADRFLVIAGDVLTDLDLSAAWDFHTSHRAEASIVLTHQDNPLPFGVVITDDEGRIIRFLEKPSWGEVFSDTVNTGIYILEKSLMARWPADCNVDFGHDLFPQTLADRRPMYGVVSDGYWRDVGHVDDYAAAHFDLMAGRIRVRWPAPERRIGHTRLIAGHDCVIAADARLSGTVVLGDRVSIGPRAQIVDSVIGPGTVIGQGAMIRRSVLWSAVSVGMGCDLNEAVVQSGARLGGKVTLRERTIVSEMCRLGENVTVQPNCRIWPRKTVEDGARVSSSIVWGEQYNRELFTDAKVSGLTNREMTPEFAARLGGAFAAQFALGSTLVVARDQSVEARAITEALKSGVTSAGVHVRDLRDTVVPILRFDLSQGQQERAYQGGVYVRRSPDDRHVTDAIFFDAAGFDLSVGTARAVERVFFREDFRRVDSDRIGTIRYPEHVLDRYRDMFLLRVNADVIREQHFRIIVDYANGPMAAVLPSILAQLGVESVALNGIPGDADPVAHDAAQRSLGRIVTALEYDLAAQINAAGEKLVLVDRRGVTLSGQDLLLPVAALFWRGHPGATIAVPVMASATLDELATQHRGTVYRVKSDHLAMMIAASSGKADLVAGTRGGFIVPAWQRAADAAAALVHILEMLASGGVALDELAREHHPGVFAEAVVPCAWNRKGNLMRRLMQETATQERSLIDGVRLRVDRGWLWVGPDRRSAHFRLLAEGATAADAQAIAAEWSARLTSWIEEMDAASAPERDGADEGAEQ